MTTTTSRLDTIATRQRTSRVQTLVFTAFLALAGVISISAINTAVAAASPTHVVKR